MKTARPTYAALWREKYTEDQASFETLVGMDLWQNWDRWLEPEVQAWNHLRNGLDVLWGGDEVMAQAFLRRAHEFSARAEAEKSPLDVAFPLNRGELRRIRTYAGCLCAAPEETSAARVRLLDAAEDFAEWCRKLKGHEWDSQGQAHHLTAVRLTLIVGDSERAQALFKTRRGFKYHEEEHGLLRDLAAGHRDEAVQRRFETYFDRLRNPDFRPEVFLEPNYVRLEFALLEALFFGPGEPVDWLQAARSVAS